MSIKWQVHFSASILLLFYMLTGRFADYMIIVLSVFFHECGHLLAARIVGVKVESVRFFIYGADMRFKTDFIAPYQQFAIACGGPLVTLFILVIFSIESDWSYVQVVEMQKLLLLINLCPIWPLDGGRIVQSIIASTFQSTNIEELFLKLSLFVAGITAVLAMLFMKPFLVLLFSVVCQQIVVEIKQFPLRSAYRRIVLRKD